MNKHFIFISALLLFSHFQSSRLYSTPGELIGYHITADDGTHIVRTSNNGIVIFQVTRDVETTIVSTYEDLPSHLIHDLTAQHGIGIRGPEAEKQFKAIEALWNAALAHGFAESVFSN